MANIILGPIIGGLSHDRVKLWARADRTSTLYAWLATKADLSDTKLIGKAQLGRSNGFAGVVAANELKPARKYHFALTLDSKSPHKTAYQSFTTFPSPGKAANFRFAFGSCFLPMRDEPGLAFKHILENESDLAFMLMLGDQIYADVGENNGLGHVAVNLPEYREIYRHVWSNKYLRKLLGRTPAFMILDDHEVDNDWHWTDRGLSRPAISGLNRLFRLLRGRPREEQFLSQPRARAALKANWEHQAIHAPGKLSESGTLAYSFEFGRAAFFVLDTRTQRFISRTDRQLLGDKQWSMLTNWLRRAAYEYPVKFIVSSISILSDLIGDWTNDRWSGFKKERNRLLNLLAEEGIEGVHFLTGDLHSAHSISAKLKGPDGKAIPVWEFCSSPFEQKPSRIVKILDWPAHSPSLEDRKRHFTMSEINYGIIEVDFSQKEPRVLFRLNYEKRGQWFTR